MKKEHEIVFSPIKVGSIELKNRITMCPMEGTGCLGWTLGKGYDSGAENLLINRAKDGVGLIIPGAVSIYSFTGHKWLYKHPEAFGDTKQLMDKLHSYGTKFFFQFTAGLGRNFSMVPVLKKHYKLANRLVPIDLMTASASEAPNVWMSEVKSRALTKAEIEELIYAFAEAAYLAQQNGVDGIEVHAVHEGYLLDQFAMSYINHRTDEYGGSLENRLRFTCDIVKAVKKRCGEDFPVSLRYSVTSKMKGFNQGIIPQDKTSAEVGRDFKESVKAIKILEDAGYDMFNCDNGTYDSWYYPHPPVYMPLNCNLEEARAIKKYTSKPVFCAGRMQIDEAAEAISAGELDGVSIGRQFLADECFLTKVREERFEDIRPCISCHVGCMPIGRHKNSGTTFDSIPSGRCALNPYTKMEDKYAVKPAKRPRKIAVIGAGVAGMEVALQLSRRGHSVDLYEKSGRLGGVFNEAARFSFKEKDRDLLAYYRTQIGKADISLHLNTEITDISKLDADEIVISTGAGSARTLKVPGGERAIPAVEYLRQPELTGDRVVIVGGGLTGCEIAYELALQGKHPAIVEMQEDILTDKTAAMANTSFLRDAFAYYGVPVYVESKTVSIGEASVDIESGNQIKTIPADTVVVSIGFVSGTKFDTKDKHVHAIGDADHIANLKNAIWQANDLALELNK